MELNKSNIKKIMGMITASLVIFWGLNHLQAIGRAISGFVGMISPFLLGLCFAFLINILLGKIEKVWDTVLGNRTGTLWKKIKRPVCLILSFIVIIGVICIILFLIIPELKKNIVTIVDMVPQYAAYIRDGWNDLAAFLAQYSLVLPQADIDGTGIQDFLSQYGETLLNKTMDITVSIGSGLVNTVLGLVMSIYVLLQKEKLAVQAKKLLFAMIPVKRAQQATGLFRLANRIFTNFVTGQLLEAVIIGVLCFIGMLLLHMPYAAIISVLVGFTALIPIFGALVGAAIGALLILVVNPWQAIQFLIFLVILQQLEGHIIYPRVVGKSVGLPGLWVLITITVGGNMFGVLGMLLGVPICSFFYCVIQQAVRNQLTKKGIEINE
ncbi:MAG: AI-2E family transporter [Eubacteriales bacterium]|nr:AI-2E family transporter [Eubacteriales bacterium]